MANPSIPPISVSTRVLLGETLINQLAKEAILQSDKSHLSFLDKCDQLAQREYDRNVRLVVARISEEIQLKADEIRKANE